MKTILIAALAAFTLSGCTQFLGEEPMKVLNDAVEKGKEIKDETLNATADTVDAYCDKVPETVRLWLRDEVNGRTEKGDVHIDCVP